MGIHGDEVCPDGEWPKDEGGRIVLSPVIMLSTADQEELLAIDPDLRAALYGPESAPFSLTLVFPRFEGPDYERAVEMARSLASEYRETGEGEQFRHRARFFPDRPLKLRDLFEVVGRLDETQVLIDDRPVPYARELWLPLFWFLIPR